MTNVEVARKDVLIKNTLFKTLHDLLLANVQNVHERNTLPATRVKDLIIRNVRELQLVRTLGEVAPPFTSWRHFLWAICCRFFSHSGNTNRLLTIRNWNEMYELMHRRVDAQGFVESTLEFSGPKAKEENEVGEPYEKNQSNPVPLNNELQCASVLDNETYPVKGCIFNNFPPWAHVEYPKKGKKVLLVEVICRVTRPDTVQSSNQLIMNDDTNALGVTVIGIYDSDSHGGIMDLQNVDEFLNFKESGTTFHQVWKDWSTKVSNRTHDSAQFQQAMEILDRNKDTITDEEYDFRKHLIERKHHNLWQFLWLLEGPNLFAEGGLETVFFSGAPQIPANIIDAMNGLTKEVFVDWQKDKGSITRLDYQEKKLKVFELIKKECVWMTPKANNRRDLADRSFMTDAERIRINQQMKTEEQRFRNEGNPDYTHKYPQNQDMVLNINPFNTMAILILSNNQAFPIQELQMPYAANYDFKNALGQLYQTTFHQDKKQEDNGTLFWKPSCYLEPKRMSYVRTAVQQLELHANEPDFHNMSIRTYQYPKREHGRSVLMKQRYYGFEHGPPVSVFGSTPAMGSFSVIAMQGLAVIEKITESGNTRIGDSYISALTFVTGFAPYRFTPATVPPSIFDNWTPHRIGGELQSIKKNQVKTYSLRRDKIAKYLETRGIQFQYFCTSRRPSGKS